MTTNTYVGGKIWVRKVRCKTCIFGTKSPVDDERRDGMVWDADANESCIPCHHHLYQGEPIEPVCRGYYDLHTSVTLRLADAMGVTEFTDREPA